MLPQVEFFSNHGLRFKNPCDASFLELVLGRHLCPFGGNFVCGKPESDIASSIVSIFALGEYGLERDASDKVY